MYLLKDMTHVVGKNRKELLAMAKGHSEDKKGLWEFFASYNELNSLCNMYSPEKLYLYNYTGK